MDEPFEDELCNPPLDTHRLLGVAGVDDMMGTPGMMDDTYDDLELEVYVPSAAERVAAAGSALAVPNLSDEERMEAVQQITESAPEHLQGNFQMCCALFLYRKLLVDAVEANDTGMIYEAQSAVLTLIEPE